MINWLLEFIFQRENKLEYLEQLLQMDVIPWYRIDIHIKKWSLESNFKTIAYGALKELNDAFTNISNIQDLIQKEMMLEALSLRLEKETMSYHKLFNSPYQSYLEDKEHWYEYETNSFGNRSTPIFEFLMNKLKKIVKDMFSQLNKDTIPQLSQKKVKWVQYAITHHQFDLLYEIERVFKEADYALIEGPIQKSPCTDELIMIVRKFLLGKNYELQIDQNETILVIDEVRYHWNKIIKYADLEHIKLESQDMILYSAYMDKCPANIGYMWCETKSKLDPLLEEQYKTKLYAQAVLDYDYIEPLISFQEMQAINIYTTEWSRLINGILRDTVDIHKESPGIFKFALIQAVFCASGLNKLPKTKLVELVTRGEEYRGSSEQLLANKIQIERVKAAAVQGVVDMKGFISTTMKPSVSSNMFFNAPVQLQIVPSKGADISSISVDPDENELLMPPTRMKVTQYSDGCCFTFQPVSDVSSKDLSPEKMTIDESKNRGQEYC